MARLRPDLLRSGKEFLRLFGGHVKTWLTGALLGALGLVSLGWNLRLPTWAWFAGMGACAVWIVFRVFHDVRVQRDEARMRLDQHSTPSQQNEWTMQADVIEDGNSVLLLLKSRTGNRPVERGFACDVLSPSGSLPARSLIDIRTGTTNCLRCDYPHEFGGPGVSGLNSGEYAVTWYEADRNRDWRKIYVETFEVPRGDVAGAPKPTEDRTLVVESAQVLKKPDEGDPDVTRVIFDTTGRPQKIGTGRRPRKLRFTTPMQRTVAENDLPAELPCDDGLLVVKTFTDSGFTISATVSLPVVEAEVYF